MIFQLQRYTIDTDRRELTLSGKAVHVEPQVFDLLVFLIENRDRVVSRDELFSAVWKGRIVSDATLSSRISAARRAIGDDGEKQAYIRTIARHGFLFAGELIKTESKAHAPEAVGQPERRQNITFCKTPEGIRLAVATVGEGSNLVKTANWLNHLDYDWRSPFWQPLLQALASTHQLIRYDARGTGLSDWSAQEISFDAFVRDLETVVDALGLERFSLFGMSQGAAVAATYAARHSERVDKLVLHGAYAQGRRRRNSLEDEDQANALTALMRYGWAKEHSPFMQAFSSIYFPKATTEQVRWFIELQRVSTSSENALRIRHACDDIDIVDLLPTIRTPTLVTHCRYDNVAPFEQARLIAAAIPNARLVPLESENHAILPDEVVWPTWLREIEDFLAG